MSSDRPQLRFRTKAIIDWTCLQSSMNRCVWFTHLHIPKKTNITMKSLSPTKVSPLINQHQIKILGKSQFSEIQSVSRNETLSTSRYSIRIHLEVQKSNNQTIIVPYLRTIFKNLLGGSPINLLINDMEPQYNGVLITSVSILLYIDQNFYHDYRVLYLGF